MTEQTSDFAPALATAAQQTASVVVSQSSTAGSLSQVSADPSSLSDGMVWLRSDLFALCARISGSTYRWFQPQKYGTTIDIVSSTTETDILQASGYTIPANQLGANGTARATLHFDYLNNTGGNLALPTIRVYLGGTKLIDVGTNASVASTANRQAGTIIVDVQNKGATNSQVATVRIATGHAGGLTTGNGSTWGDSNGSGYRFGFGQNTGSVDTTASALFRVTAQLSSSSASHELRCFASTLEFL